jgi:polyphosphate kinase
MPRNLDTRVELVTPVEEPELQIELQDTLDRCLADDSSAWTLGSDRRWSRRGGGTRSAHRELTERAHSQWAAATS